MNQNPLDGEAKQNTDASADDSGEPTPETRVSEQMVQEDIRDRKARDHADTKATVFSLMQYERHPDTGEVLLTQDQIDSGLAMASIKKYAYAWHDLDAYTHAEVALNPDVQVGQLKNLHVHLVVMTEDRCEVAQIARWFSVPPRFVRVPSEETRPYTGRGARSKAFFDYSQYLVHQGPKQEAKYQYPDDVVIANFDFRKELEEHMATRGPDSKNAGRKKLDKLLLAVGTEGKRLREVRTEEPLLYIRNQDLFRKTRADFLLHQDPPRHRTNHYIGGRLGEKKLGRTGKTQLARLFARALYPELEASECYHEASDKRVPLQTYKGQPVVIWDDYSPVDLMDALGGRTGVWQVFDDHPGAGDVNIKFGSTRLVHEVNIITRVTPYAEFFDALAGDYVDRAGVQHHAEDARQSWGRFPFVTEVTEGSFSLLVNQGFVDDTAEFKAFVKVATMRASMAEIGRALDSIESSEERERAMYEVGGMLLRPMLDQHGSIQPKPQLTKAEALAGLLPTLSVYTGDALDVYETDQFMQASIDADLDHFLAQQVVAEAQDAVDVDISEWEASAVVDDLVTDPLHVVEHAQVRRMGSSCGDSKSTCSGAPQLPVPDAVERSLELDRRVVAARKNFQAFIANVDPQYIGQGVAYSA